MNEKENKLIITIAKGETAIGKQLIEGGLNVHYIEPESNWTLLNFAVEHGNLEMIGSLLDYGVDVNYMGEGKGSWTATHHAVESAFDFFCQHGYEEPDTEVLEFLLSRNPGLTLRDWTNKTPVDYAEHEKLKRLLQNKEDASK